MLDHIYVRLATRRPLEIDPNYQPSAVIQHEKLLIAGSHHLAIIIPPWHRARLFQNLLAKRLHKNGIDVLDYDFNPNILEANQLRVIDSIQTASNAVTNRINQLRQQYGYERIHLITMSLGSITQSLVAHDLPHFDTATFIATGDDLASGLWHGKRTWQLRQSFEEQGITYKDLSEAWEVVAPRNYTTAFSGKLVRFIASANDTIVPTAEQTRFIEGLQAAGADIRYDHSRYGHLMTPGIFCVAGNLEHIVGFDDWRRKAV